MPNRFDSVMILAGLISAFALTGCSEGAPDTPGSPQLEEISLPSGGLLPGEFTRVTSVRELPDGGLLVADRGSPPALYWIDSDREVHEVGRVGEGPREYQAVTMLLAFRADSTGLYDGASRRIVHLEGREFTGGSTSVNREDMSRLLGADTLGHWLVGEQYGRPGAAQRADGARLVIDSILVTRRDRDLAILDTVAALQRGSTAYTRRDGVPLMVPHPMPHQDHVHMFPDGWVAVVLAHAYRVDWVAPDGRYIEGKGRLDGPYPVGREEIDELIRRRGVPPEVWEQQYSDFVEWPETLPGAAQIAAAPDGSALVRRILPATDDRVRYDQVDRTGNVVAYFVLQDNQEVVGTGRNHLFLIETDALDIQRLRAVPWDTR